MNNEQKRNENYNKYVDRVTPKQNCFQNCVKAFIAGGLICMIGQILSGIFLQLGFTNSDAAALMMICLILGSVLLTGLGVYPLITAWAGAGSLVPITGFANSVAAPAIEFRLEGMVAGVGTKIFTIAGPVILYGVCTSWIVGAIYLIVHMVL